MPKLSPRKRRNARRVATVTRMMKARGPNGWDPYGMQHNLTDMLADMRHWADSKGLDFHDALDSSYQHYLAEKNGDDIEDAQDAAMTYEAAAAIQAGAQLPVGELRPDLARIASTANDIEVSRCPHCQKELAMDGECFDEMCDSHRGA